MNVPGRLGGENDADDDQRWPDPLNCKRDLVSPLVITSEEALEDTSSNQLTNNPAQVDIGGEISTDLDGSNFRGVGSRERLENTPRDALEDGTGEEGLDILREERDEDHGSHEDERAEHGLLVPDLVGDPTIKVQTEDLTNLSSSADGSLPSGADNSVARKGIVAGVDLITKPVSEPAGF